MAKEIFISYSRRDFDKVKAIKDQIEEGPADPKEQNDLGNRYYDGDGVPQDYAEAVKWYRKAAEKGNREAQYILNL